MNDLWNQVQKLEGRKIDSTTGRITFTITGVDDDRVHLEPSATNVPRHISRWRVEKAVELYRRGLVRPVDMQREGVSARNSTYVAAIAKALSGSG